MMPNHIAILGSLLVGLAATLGTIVIHGFVVHTIVMTLRSNLQRGVLRVRIWVNMTFIVSATLLALTGHLVEIALWAFALDICGAVADISAAIYSSAGSYRLWVPTLYCRHDGSCWDHSKRCPEC
jgi:hypothetical protein